MLNLETVFLERTETLKSLSPGGGRWDFHPASGATGSVTLGEYPGCACASVSYFEER